jgi:uncharacterized protein YegJ (DUF2314 family)
MLYRVLPLIRSVRDTTGIAALAGLVAAALVLLPAGASRAEDSVVSFAVEDPDMVRAIEEARSHLDLVLSKLVDEEGKIHLALNLKAQLPVNRLDVKAEVIWVSELALDGDRFHGKIASEPAYLAGVALGDPVSFTRAQIADWSVLSTDGRMYGHYTTRALLDDLPRAEAAAIADLLSPDPLPEAWR